MIRTKMGQARGCQFTNQRALLSLILWCGMTAVGCAATTPATGGGAPLLPTPDLTATAAAVVLEQALAPPEPAPIVVAVATPLSIDTVPATSTPVAPSIATIDVAATSTAEAVSVETAVAATLTAQPTFTTAPFSSPTSPPFFTSTIDLPATEYAMATQVAEQVQAALITVPAPTATSSYPVVRWVEIPEGDFIMGSDAADLQATVEECNRWEGNCQWDWFDGELPRRTVWLPAFKIMMYEVTNADYAACVHAGNCAPAGRAISDSNIPYTPALSLPDRPVVGVSLHDAILFCSWLGAKLPTEEEWEKAARGIDGRIYPWGNRLELDLANIGGDEPAVVGNHPGGASPWGVQDMAGNVFEWTSSREGNRYVLRGGSWFVFPFRARAADRGTKLEPTFANYDVGFRCVH
jgi:formylglycine-generating enzyme required for sulfatase activity